MRRLFVVSALIVMSTVMFQSPRGMQMCSPPDLPIASKSPTMESASHTIIRSDDITNDTPPNQPKNQRTGCILKFSIDKIMEPDVGKVKSGKDKSKVSRPSEASYDSAFKKYVPSSGSVQQFVSNRQQDLLSQYPLLYYPNQLMCAAAQYAVLTQHSNAVNLLNNNHSSPNSATTLTTLSNLTIQSYHHNHSIKRPISPCHDKLSISTNHTPNKLSRKTMQNETPADKKSASSNNHVRSVPTHANIAAQSQSAPSAATTSIKQKTFACPECGKVFNAHYNLTRHMPGTIIKIFFKKLLYNTLTNIF